MGSCSCSCVWLGLFMVLMGFIWRCDGYNTFYVGGKYGWLLKTKEPYNQWAGRNRFQVNDTLVFKYRKGHNSVLLVTEENYNNCNKSHPVQKLEHPYGHSEFKFDRSGPFFFISGHNHNCNNGQKLIVVVLAVRNHSPATPTPAPVAPSPSLIPPYSPTISPEVYAPAPAPAPHASQAVGVSFSLFLGLMSLVLVCFVGLL